MIKFVVRYERDCRANIMPWPTWRGLAAAQQLLPPTQRTYRTTTTAGGGDVTAHRGGDGDAAVVSVNILGRESVKPNLRHVDGRGWEAAAQRKKQRNHNNNHRHHNERNNNTREQTT